METNRDHSKIHWLKWDGLGLSKEVRGLGFRDFKSFNLAMLAKQSWRMLTNPESLTAQVFKHKYFPHKDLLEALLGNKPSYVWRSIKAEQ